jgi:hypothetical protein
MMTTGIAIPAALAAGILTTSTLAQHVWTVCQDGSCDFSTIQSAINHAANGDVVELSAGTFFEPELVIHNLDITIAGSATGTTELNGSLTNRIASITGTSSVQFRNIVFRDGRALASAGGAIQFTGTTLKIADCRFHNNHARKGGAIWAEGGRVRVIASEFNHNSAIGTDWPTGGAIFAAGVTTTLARCLFSNNSATYEGGAVGLVAGSLSAVSSVFNSNSAVRGGALRVYAHGFSLTLVNCTLVNNTGSAQTGGTVIQSYYSEVRLVNTVISGNGVLLRSLYGGGFTGSHSLISHGTLAGWGNRVGDPMLSSAFEPMPGSPCLDSGTARLVFSEFDLLGAGSSCFPYADDFYGGTRFRDAGARQSGSTGCVDIVGRVDIGAVEGNGPPRPTPRIGDLNADGVVDGADLAIVLSNWGVSICDADLNASGLVDGLDLGALLGSWGLCR